jgi:hypothetical protein
MRFPALAACQVRWQLTPDEESMVPATSAAPEVDGFAAITVHDEAGEGPDDSQRAAYRFLMQNEDQVASNVLSGLVRYVRLSLAGSPFQPHVERLGLLSVDGIRDLVELVRIGFLKQDKDNEGYVTVEIGCDWDEEHGISVLLHHGRVLATSVGCDFSHRGSTENLEATAQKCREAVDRALEPDHLPHKLVRVPDELYQRLKELAERNDCPLSREVKRALEAHLRREGEGQQS